MTYHKYSPDEAKERAEAKCSELRATMQAGIRTLFSIHERLPAQNQEFAALSEASRALVLVKDAELDQAVHQFFPRLRTAKPKRIRSSAGYHHDVQAGKEVAFSRKGNLHDH